MPRKRHRVLYVQKAPGGGSVVSLHELVRGLDRSRFEPVVLFHRPSDYVPAFRALGARVLVLDEWLAGERACRTGRVGPRNDLIVAWLLARRIRAEGIDLVHHNNNLRANRVSVLAAWLAGVPQVCHVRMLRPYSRWTDRLLAGCVRRFIYISTAVERQCRRSIGIPEHKGEVILDPVDVTAFANAGCAARRIRAEFSLGERDPLIANVGRLVAWKGQDYFLRAMAEVARSHPTAKALIVGAPNESAESQAFFHNLQRLAERLGLVDRVIFTGFRSDVPELMAAADIIVHSSSEPEPLGRVVMEGMAAGRPVVATAAGGVLETVIHGETGILVPLKDPGAMARAILRLLANRGEAERMGRRAREHVAERFSLPRYMEAIHRGYAAILEGRSGRKKKPSTGKGKRHGGGKRPAAAA